MGCPPSGPQRPGLSETSSLHMAPASGPHQSLSVTGEGGWATDPGQRHPTSTELPTAHQHPGQILLPLEDLREWLLANSYLAHL